MTKILLVGKIGQLGWELQRTLPCLGHVQAIDYPDIDLCDQSAVRALVQRTRPEILINAAAYTNVDGAETNLDVAQKINGIAPGLLAAELADVGGKLMVHYSTDYVFNGKSARPYLEDDPVDPVNAYGRTKLAGEQAIAASGCPHLIFRTQWLYASRGKNFLLTILRLAREGKPLRIIADQIGSPTTARMLAELTALVLLQVRSKDVAAVSGIYHSTAAGQATWYDFTKAILEEANAIADGRLEWCRNALQSLQPITTAQYPTPAARPAYSVMSNEKLQRSFGVRIPEWRAQLRLCLEELQGSAALA